MKRPTGILKQDNCYTRSVPEYADIPKAVWAAMAISALTVGGDYLNEASARVMAEWQILHENGIVPQKPPKKK